jgi:glucoamylase
MTEGTRPAPGWPGIEARWTTSAKSAVGTALGDGSRVWFTASHGILNEIYFPEVDTACTRDVGILVSSADGFFSEEKRDCAHVVEWVGPGVPAFRLRNSCNSGRYEIEKRVCASDGFDVVLQHIRFAPKVGTLADYRVTVLVSPHLGNHGAGNTGWVGCAQHRQSGHSPWPSSSPISHRCIRRVEHCSLPCLDLESPPSFSVIHSISGFPG